MKTKRDTATHRMKRDLSTCTTYNRAHLLDSVDISIGSNMVVVLVAIVFFYNSQVSFK